MEWSETFAPHRTYESDEVEVQRSQFVSVQTALCFSCERSNVWVAEASGFRDEYDSYTPPYELVWPAIQLLGPAPHSELPDSLLDDFEEARRTVSVSPRGSAALSRLVLQQLLVHLGGKGKHIDTDIKKLVEKGNLRERVEQALDVVRVIGNEAVHPGEIDLKDDQQLAVRLLKVINMIVDDAIARDKEMDDLFNELPESKKKRIAERDGKQS
jgi:hypothetical protein